MSHKHAASRFYDLHTAGTFVLPNAWDAGSAAVIATVEPVAIATSSAGVSWSVGVRDGDNLDRDSMVASLRRIIGVVDIPVSADIETGYGESPAEVADTIVAVIDAGAVGVNIEDRVWSSPATLRPIDEQCERLLAAREAADGHEGQPFVINARCDVYLAAIGAEAKREQLALERAHAYAQAGADCLFLPGLVDLAKIAQLVKAVPLPLNTLLVADRGPTIAELKATGVRRISVGHAIAAAAYTRTRDAAQALLADDDAPLRDAMPTSELQVLMPARAEAAR